MIRSLDREKNMDFLKKQKQILFQNANLLEFQKFS